MHTHTTPPTNTLLAVHHGHWDKVQGSKGKEIVSGEWDVWRRIKPVHTTFNSGWVVYLHWALGIGIWALYSVQRYSLAWRETIGTCYTDRGEGYTYGATYYNYIRQYKNAPYKVGQYHNVYSYCKTIPCILKQANTADLKLLTWNAALLNILYRRTELLVDPQHNV